MRYIFSVRWHFPEHKKIHSNHASHQPGMIFMNPPFTGKDSTKVAVRKAKLTSNPPVVPALLLDSVLQVVGGEVASPRSGVLHGSTIVPPDTLRKHHCVMSSNKVRGRTFGTWLKHQLDRREWSQADLAKRMHVTNGMVSRWVRGERVPSTDSIDRLADVLMVDVDQLLTLAGHRPPVFEIDPNSAEAKLLPFIRAVDWSKHDRELAMIQRQLEFIAEVDRGEHDKAGD